MLLKIKIKKNLNHTWTQSPWNSDDVFSFGNDLQMLMCQSPRREYLSQVLPLEILGSHTDVHLLIMEIMYLVNVLVWREGNTNYLATREPFKSFLMFRLPSLPLPRRFCWWQVLQPVCLAGTPLAAGCARVQQLCSRWCLSLRDEGLWWPCVSQRGFCWMRLCRRSVCGPMKGRGGGKAAEVIKGWRVGA